MQYKMHAPFMAAFEALLDEVAMTAYAAGAEDMLREMTGGPVRQPRANAHREGELAVAEGETLEEAQAYADRVMAAWNASAQDDFDAFEAVEDDEDDFEASALEAYEFVPADCECPECRPDLWVEWPATLEPYQGDSGDETKARTPEPGDINWPGY